LRKNSASASGQRPTPITTAATQRNLIASPGTVNYPDTKKLKRGRVPVSTSIVEFDPEALWTAEEIEAAFPLPERKSDGTTIGTPDEASLPADTMQIIRDGVPKGEQSDAFWNVVLVLKRDGWTVDGIIALFEKYPDGIGKKYRGRLRREVERVYDKIKKETRQGAAVRPDDGPALCAEALKAMTFAPIKYVVPEIIVEGLTLLAGKPKMGKSWLLLHTAIAVASGGFTLGDIHCIEGDVLYCALEDSLRRLQSRMTKLLGISQPWPKRLHFRCEMPRLSEGGLDVIKQWIESVDHPRLIIIDILASVRSPKKKEQTQYDADYDSVVALRTLANERGIAVVVVHHLRKADADDAFDTISATLGLTGAPDSVLVLKHDSTGNIILHGKGRDLLEIEKAVTFDRESCLWRIAGDAAAVRRSSERAAVLEAVEEAGQPIGPNDIAAVTGMRAGNVRRLLAKLAKEGVIQKAGYGRYRTAQVLPV
jgi:predicted transcriptional regulator